MTDLEILVAADFLDRITRLETRIAGFCAAVGATAVFTIILPAIAGAVGRFLS
jgi:hypothetical protein